MTGWSLRYDGYDPANERLREALCTLGNGYFATRGALPQSVADDVHYPGTYMAGCYNRLQTAIDDHVVENEDLVNLPNWLSLGFRIKDGPWFDIDHVDILSYRMELDMGCGVLRHEIRFKDDEGRTTSLNSERLVHMRHPHLAAMRTTITAEDWSGRISICSALDGRIVNAGVERYRDLNDRHWRRAETGTLGSVISLKARTNQSEIAVCQAARTHVFIDGERRRVGRRIATKRDFIAQEFSVDVCEGTELRIDKVVAIYSSRDTAISECGTAARKAATTALDFDKLMENHIEAWAMLWQRFDIAIDGETCRGETETTLRLHLFHLLQTVSPNNLDLDAGVPARGLHGEAYRGHIFWDEMFIFPTLNYRLPEITRALLMYRYRRLDAARTAAKRAGLAGAMYPWQSGSSGREESQKLHLNPRSGRWIEDLTHLQRHVNAAIAYDVWQYYQVTGDTEFLSFFGAEMLLEIARFWATVATYDPELERYELLGVVGPDEYHDRYPGADRPGLDNNAYTNIMAAWVLCRALDVLDTLPADRRGELRDMLDLDSDEIDRWRDISRKMRVVFHDDGIISQFEGYDELEEFDWQGYRKRYGDIDRLDRILEAEGDTPNRYKLSKQADVLMLFYLFSSEELGELFDRLGYPFEYETIPRNIEYYSARTSHGSTLSRVVHSWVLARSDRAGSWRLFCKALDSDVADIQGGTTPEGIHLGAMAGTVDIIQRCYTGIEARGDVLWLNPRLPEHLHHLHLRVRYRGHSLAIDLTHKSATVRALHSAAAGILIGVNGETHELTADREQSYDLQDP